MNLKIRNLTKSFNGVTVLNNINLDIEDFHSLTIIGPSGGGKSTLLRIIAGLEIPDSGEIFVNGIKIEYNEKYLREYRKKIGMVFQSYNLFPHMTALKNISLPLEKVHNMEESKAEKIGNSYLKRFQLLEHSFKKPSQLSGGQQQRVAIARALSINPSFLLLDEPTSALDPDLTKEVLDTIISLKDEDKDMILVTHEMGFAKQASDFLLFISEGVVKEQGKTIEVFKSPKSTELINFLSRVLDWK